MRGERRRVVTYETDVGKEKEKKKKRSVGRISMDVLASVSCLLRTQVTAHL